MSTEPRFDRVFWCISDMGRSNDFALTASVLDFDALKNHPIHEHFYLSVFGSFLRCLANVISTYQFSVGVPQPFRPEPFQRLYACLPTSHPAWQYRQTRLTLFAKVCPPL